MRCCSAALGTVLGMLPVFWATAALCFPSSLARSGIQRADSRTGVTERVFRFSGPGRSKPAVLPTEPLVALRAPAVRFSRRPPPCGSTAGRGGGPCAPAEFESFRSETVTPNAPGEAESRENRLDALPSRASTRSRLSTGSLCGETVAASRLPGAGLAKSRPIPQPTPSARAFDAPALQVVQQKSSSPAGFPDSRPLRCV